MFRLGKGSSGFSLLEVMVVVAILGILATIAVPSYKGFVSRARQKEAFSLLSAYYMAASATRSEFGFFPGNFVQTGFAPTGLVSHRVRVQDGMDLSIPENDNGCVSTANANMCDCDMMACPMFKTWSEPPDAELGVLGLRVGPNGTNGLSDCPGGWHGSTTDDTFTATALGVVSPDASMFDFHEINHQKVLTICSDGTL